MTEHDKEKVIDRIRKILALAGNNPNEAEASAAAAKAQAMLAEYNLEMTDVHKDSTKIDMIMDNEIKMNSRPWPRTMAHMVAQMYFCGYYFVWIKELSATKKCGYNRYDRHVFMGEKHNVIVTKMMFKYLVDAVDRLAREAAIEVPQRERGAFTNSFRLACANRLCWRIQERINAAKRGEIKTESGANLPALLGMYDQAQRQLKKFQEQEDLKVRATKSRAKSNHAGGALAGDAAGKKISLDQQLAGSRASAMIK